MTSQLLMLHEAAKLLPKNSGRPVHVNTVRRWVDKGVLLKGGRRVRLKSERIGWRIYTSAQWIEDFVKECSDWTEPARVTERKGTPPDVLMRLKARGFDGPEEKRKVLGLPQRGGRARALPRVLPVGPLCDQNEPHHGTRVS